jgi:protocadherin-15
MRDQKKVICNLQIGIPPFITRFLSRRLQTSEDKTTKMIVIPRYEPVFVEANLKEYETQVLQMSVPIDELQDHEMQMDQRDLRDHSFNLDSISYITKDRFSSSREFKDRVGSNSHLMSIDFRRLSGQQRPHPHHQRDVPRRPGPPLLDGGGPRLAHQEPALQAVSGGRPLNHTLANMSVSRSDSEEGLRRLSASQTNANVLFGANASGGNKFTSSTPRRRKADSSSSTSSSDRGGGQLDDSSPIDSTTQL